MGDETGLLGWTIDSTDANCQTLVARGGANADGSHRVYRIKAVARVDAFVFDATGIDAAGHPHCCDWPNETDAREYCQGIEDADVRAAMLRSGQESDQRMLNIDAWCYRTERAIRENLDRRVQELRDEFGS